MSTYGYVAAPTPTAPLHPLVYPLKSGSLSTHPVSHTDVPADLVDYLYTVFTRELEEGKSYPQEGPLDLEGYKTYFFTTASSTIIGILHSEVLETPPSSIEEARGGRSWEDCVGGSYYVKPNYPGRSSHNCNGGFLVPHSQRGKGAGVALAKSFLIYAPALRYRASVFNLVYESNTASLRLWDKLGFDRVGRIPNAGRLKTGPNGTEEYVDAIVVYKSFV